LWKLRSRSYPAAAMPKPSERPTDRQPADAAGPNDPRVKAARSDAEDETPTLRVGNATAAPVPVPTWQDRYEDMGELRRGGMSSIHTVYDRLMRRWVAM
jgi:hypothetical protein